jgi:hypothetical protein
LVIIWLKRCPARLLIEPSLEPGTIAGGAFVLGADMGLGDGVGVADGVGVGDGLGVGVGVGGEHSTHSSTGVGEGDRDCAHAGDDCAASSATKSVADNRTLRVKFAMVSARTACR